MKKILIGFFVIVLLLLIAFCIFAICSNIETIINLKASFPEYHMDLIQNNFIEIIFFSVSIIVFLTNVIIIVLISFNFLHFIKYSYDEYKSIMNKKKTDKQKRKKQKLQQQLNDLDKTE